jgi:hypothetical protein
MNDAATTKAGSYISGADDPNIGGVDYSYPVFSVGVRGFDCQILNASVLYCELGPPGAGILARAPVGRVERRMYREGCSVGAGRTAGCHSDSLNLLPCDAIYDPPGISDTSFG